MLYAIGYTVIATAMSGLFARINCHKYTVERNVAIGMIFGILWPLVFVAFPLASAAYFASEKGSKT